MFGEWVGSNTFNDSESEVLDILRHLLEVAGRHWTQVQLRYLEPVSDWRA